MNLRQLRVATEILIHRMTMITVNGVFKL